MKQEGGRYRPFSTTTVRTPQLTPAASPLPRHPDPASVEIYKEYIDSIALQTHLVSAADKRTRKPRQTVSGEPRYSTAASSYHDGASSSVQYSAAADSGRPTPGSMAATGSAAEKASVHLGSAQPVSASAASATAAAAAAAAAASDRDPGPDPLGVHQALDIIRLSPKAQPPRTSRTSRGGRSHREQEGEEGGEGGGAEGGKTGEGQEGEAGAKTHAIFLPNVSKSATTSVCSFPDEPANATET